MSSSRDCTIINRFIRVTRVVSGRDGATTIPRARDQFREAVESSRELESFNLSVEMTPDTKL